MVAPIEDQRPSERAWSGGYDAKVSRLDGS